MTSLPTTPSPTPAPSAGFTSFVEFSTLFAQVPENERGALLQQWLKTQYEAEASQRQAELEKLKADNLRKLADLKRAADERLSVKSWHDFIVNTNLKRPPVSYILTKRSSS
jgi:Skp family chaperone for outer membrane proteins